MSKRIVRRTVDLANLPPLTAKQKAELAAVARRPERKIDLSDIPPLTAKQFRKAIRGATEGKKTNRIV